MKFPLLNEPCESESRSVMTDFLWPHGLYSPWNSAGQNTGVGSLSLLKGIFPTQGLNAWRRKWQPTPVFLPRKSHGRRSLVSMGSQSQTWLSDFTFTFSRIASEFFTSLGIQGKPQNSGVSSLSLLHAIFPNRNQTGVSCIASRFFSNWAIREALN